MFLLGEGGVRRSREGEEGGTEGGRVEMISKSVPREPENQISAMRP